MMDTVPPPVAAAPVAPQASIPPEAATDLANTEMLGSAAIAHDASTTSALEALFGEDNFRDYAAEPGPSQSPFARKPEGTEQPEAAEAGTRAAGKGEISRTQKILLAVAGGLVALLALFALFLLGTRLGAIAAPAPTPTPSASSSPAPSPSATALPAGPVEPGVWLWNELLGGECLDPYDGAWSAQFTVVDCADEHPAQLASRGTLPPAAEGATDEPYPGAEALDTQVQQLCRAAGVVDLAAAGQYSDLQVEGTYPADAEQWAAGDRSYFCFVTRSSGDPLTGSVAVTQAPAA